MTADNLTALPVLLLLAGCTNPGPNYPEGVTERFGRDRPNDAPITECAKAGGVLVVTAGPGHPTACINKEAILYVRYRY